MSLHDCYSLGLEIAGSTTWYTDAMTTTQALCDVRQVPATPLEMAAALSACSPRTTWARNQVYAVDVLKVYVSLSDLDLKRYLGAAPTDNNNAIPGPVGSRKPEGLSWGAFTRSLRALWACRKAPAKGLGPLQARALVAEAFHGPKTRAFFRALAGDPHAVVIDVHMCRVLGIDHKSVGKAAGYQAAVDLALSQGLANLHGGARDAQAVVWCGAVYGGYVRSSPNISRF